MTTSKTNLMAASAQWSSRPADQRFWTLSDLHSFKKRYEAETSTALVPLGKCEIRPLTDDPKELVLVGPKGGGATFSHYSFGQLCSLVGAPASYLRELPAELAAQNVRHGLRSMATDKDYSLMFHANGGRQLRCVTSEKYERIFDSEVAEMALRLQDRGWVTPPARVPYSITDLKTGKSSPYTGPSRIATEQDCLKHRMAGLGIQPGDVIAPAGIYGSDHDTFIFQVNEDRPIDAGNGEVLYRGVFWTNSEVGNKKFRGTMFWYEGVCGNHIVWSAKVVAEIEIRHVGEARAKFAEVYNQVLQMSDMDTRNDVKRIQSAKQFRLADVTGKTKEEAEKAVVDVVFRKGLMSRVQAEQSLETAKRFQDIHGDPFSAWGFAAGATRFSQSLQYQDQRDQLDRAAGKVLEMVF